MKIPFEINVNVENLEYKSNPQALVEDSAESWINWGLYIDDKEILDVTFKEEN